MLWGQNMEEVHMVVRIAKRYQQRGLKFCVITFYDLQRSVVDKALQAENLPAGCVYNVDSFQGMVNPSSISDPGFQLAGTVRKRGRLCNLVFSQDKACRIPEVTASHECRHDTLSQRNDSRHQ
jgi:hypothetical protein